MEDGHPEELTDGFGLRKVERDVVIPRMLKESAMAACGAEARLPRDIRAAAALTTGGRWPRSPSAATAAPSRCCGRVVGRIM